MKEIAPYKLVWISSHQPQEGTEYPPGQIACSQQLISSSTQPPPYFLHPYSLSLSRQGPPRSQSSAFQIQRHEESAIRPQVSTIQKAYSTGRVSHLVDGLGVANDDLARMQAHPDELLCLLKQFTSERDGEVSSIPNLFLLSPAS